MTALEEHEIKGVTLKLVYTVIISTIVITSSVLGVYYRLSSQIERYAADNERKWEVHQVEYNSGKITLDNSTIKLADHETRIIKLEAKN